MDFTQTICLLGMREQDAVDALGENLTQALATSATPTTHLDLERNRCSPHREVSKLTPVATMAGMGSHSTIRGIKINQFTTADVAL
jgi:hypothetical protein